MGLIEDKMFEVLKRNEFLNRTALELKQRIETQGYITDEQYADAELYLKLANENEAELEALCDIAEGKVPIARCRHCTKPVVRNAGLWRHSSAQDFFDCGKAGVPDEEYLAKWMS